MCELIPLGFCLVSERLIKFKTLSSIDPDPPCQALPARQKTGFVSAGPDFGVPWILVIANYEFTPVPLFLPPRAQAA